MLRSALLLALLLAPIAGRGQSVTTTLPAGPYSLEQCNDASYGIVVYWSIDTSIGVPPNGSFYRVLASTSDSCTYVPASGTTVLSNQVAGPIDPSAFDLTGLAAQRYPKATDSPAKAPLSAFMTPAQTSCAAGPTVYVCVQLVASGNDGTVLASTSRAKLVIETQAPSIPVITSVAPGDAALLVSWVDGADSSTAAVSYRVDVVDPACLTAPTCQDPTPHVATSTTHSARVAGLVIGVSYQVTVVSISGSGLISAPSASVLGTPVLVKDFWTLYSDAGGPEQGGCGGGPAGLVSLLALGGLVLRLRRRS